MRRVTLLRRLRDPIFLNDVLSDMVLIAYGLALFLLIMVFLKVGAALRAL